MRLSVQIEFDKTLDLKTTKMSVVVGRSTKSDLVIPHESISRSHCRIEFVKGIFKITDLGSSNGTYVDGNQLKPEVPTPFLTTSQLMIGKLDCELSESVELPDDTPMDKTQVLDTAGDYTATIRMARLDLNKPVRPVEETPSSPVVARKAASEKPAVKSTYTAAPVKRSKRPRNPISENVRTFHKVENNSKKIYTMLFLIVSLVVTWLISEGIN
ncbi:MAG: FHA domain-containing protein [Bacteriovoracia bacterium]